MGDIFKWEQTSEQPLQFIHCLHWHNKHQDSFTHAFKVFAIDTFTRWAKTLARLRICAASWPGPLISTKFVVGFLHIDAKEVFERASAFLDRLNTATTISKHKLKYGGIWRYTLKLEPVSLDNNASSFNEIWDRYHFNGLSRANPMQEMW